MPLGLIPALHRATHRIGLLIQEAPSLAVTQGEAHILAHLAGNGPSTVAELHGSLAHKPSTLTSILDRLDAARLIERSTSPQDRRSFIVSLTPAGKRLAARIYRRLAAFEAAVLKRATPDEVRAFLELIGQIERGG
jgi:DNA-binding MarR family transcriptional regulator